MTEIENLEREIAEKQARLAELRAKQVDPLLIEAREVCAKVADQIKPSLSDSYRDGDYDKDADVLYALAALRRGMELAALPAAPQGRG